MTETLRDLLHTKASDARFDAPDLDLLVHSGERRVRRRRATTGLAGIAAATVVGLGAVAVFGGSEPDQGPDVASPTLQVETPVFARGSIIYDADTTTDVGAPIRAFVRTAVGYVVVDPSGTVRSVVGGSAATVGQVDPEVIRLVADPDGSLAGWVQSDGERPAFAVLDQDEGTVQLNDDATTPGQELMADALDPAYFYAVDDGVAYWHDSRGAVAVEVGTGEVTVVQADARNGFDIVDAEAGTIAFGGGMPEISLGTTSTDIDQRLTLQESGGSVGVFSPDGAHLTLDADAPEVFDVGTGATVDFTGVPGFFATGYEWLDSDTLVMISLESEAAPVEVLTCSVSTGICEVALDDLGSVADFEAGDVVLPMGEPLTE